MKESELFNQLLGKQLRIKRHQQMKSLEELAEDVDLDDKHLGRLERGEVSKGPQSFTLYRLCRTLNINAGQLFDEIEKEIENKRDKRK